MTETLAYDSIDELWAKLRYFGRRADAVGRKLRDSLSKQSHDYYALKRADFLIQGADVRRELLRRGELD